MDIELVYSENACRHEYNFATSCEFFLTKIKLESLNGDITYDDWLHIYESYVYVYTNDTLLVLRLNEQLIESKLHKTLHYDDKTISFQLRISTTDFRNILISLPRKWKIIIGLRASPKISKSHFMCRNMSYASHQYFQGKYVIIIDDKSLQHFNCRIYNRMDGYLFSKVFDESNTRIDYIGKLQVFICDIFETGLEIPSVKQLLKNTDDISDEYFNIGYASNLWVSMISIMRSEG